MKKFVRQKADNNVPNVKIDFGAASAKVARIVEPGSYQLRVDSARVFGGKNGNVLISLDLTDIESGNKIDCRPIWVQGPNADAGNLVAENQFLIAQLLTLAKLPTAGDVSELIPKLAGVEFEAALILAVDGRTGASFNAINEINVDTDENVS